MTAPSAYQQEMAKRGMTLPKHTGCPRRRAERAIAPVRKATGPRAEARAKWPEYVRCYVEGKQSLQEIATAFGLTSQGVQYALVQMGVLRRKQGNEMKLERAMERIAQLEHDNRILRSRVTGLRLRLHNIGEAA